METSREIFIKVEGINWSKDCCEPYTDMVVMIEADNTPDISFEQEITEQLDYIEHYSMQEYKCDCDKDVENQIISYGWEQITEKEYDILQKRNYRDIGICI